jgi:hypothetical protein
VLAGDIERVQMDPRILVAGEPDVPKLAGLARVHERRVGALFVENPMRILEAQDFVVLDEVDAIDLQPPE